MKVMVFVKVTAETEAGVLETEQEAAAMDKFNEELNKAGIVLEIGGLLPSSKSARIHFTGKFDNKKVSVIDGPFTETKELVAGFWIWQVRSMEEAIEWAKRCPTPTGSDGVLELRPIA
jgi:hypothetical protein